MIKQNPDDSVRNEQFDNASGDIKGNADEKSENGADLQDTGHKDNDTSGEANGGEKSIKITDSETDEDVVGSEDIKSESEAEATRTENKKPESEEEATGTEDIKSESEAEIAGAEDKKPEAEEEIAGAEDKKPEAEEEIAGAEDKKSEAEVEVAGAEVKKSEAEVEVAGAEDKKPEAEEEVAGAEDKKTDTDDIKSESEAEATRTEDKKSETEAEIAGTEVKKPESEDDDFEEVTVSPDELEELPEVDYSSHTRAELIETLELLVENRPPSEIRDDVDNIKGLFYRRTKSENEKLRQKYVEEGGKIEDFKAPDDLLETKMRTLLSKYRGRKSEYSKQIEVEKKGNLRKKYEIIDKIKDLVNREESINKTFQEFRDLQSEWHAIGMVPQSALKNLWETYNHNVELFYDYIKINKELRDLDLRKNLEKKELLCEKAEMLLKEHNAITAFRKLQEYHQQWREIGPVPMESREGIWERFKEATSHINKRHHEHYEGQKDEQRKNLEAKRALCDRIDEINSLTITSFREWEGKAKVVIALQQEWRTIGFAPRKQNNSIYQRFREACDLFFQNKRRFYSENKEVQQENLQKKIALCEAAEALQDSTDWKVTMDKLIKLQKEWKEIGTVPRKHSDKVWKRFRSACDHFFSKKAEHFSGSDSSFEDNLRLKEALIKKIEEFEHGSDPRVALSKLNEMQKEWNEIGFVPFKKKDEIATRFREALNQQFDKLRMDEEEKAIFKYRTRLEGLKENPRASRKVRSERDKFVTRIKQLESDITLWENNIGFFSKSASAEAMIKDVQDKIDDAKNTILLLEEKIRIIDRSGLDN